MSQGVCYTVCTMNTAAHTSRLASTEDRLLVRQRATIRRLIEIQPEFFHRDPQPVEAARKNSAAPTLGVLLEFPRSLWSPRGAEIA
jgi:hypothetical protein